MYCLSKNNCANFNTSKCNYCTRNFLMYKDNFEIATYGDCTEQYCIYAIKDGRSIRCILKEYDGLKGAGSSDCENYDLPF